MYNNSKVAKAIRLAMMFGAGSAAAISAPAFAADEGAEEVEKIEVTGSRIKRSDLEGASPVTVITTEDMKIEGNLTVADALRNSNLNSFGSFSERSGSSAQSQATIDLRGAGSDRTLVLIDGKRFPGSPTLGGSSANLNAIPMAAVERIEILTDGASSTYGSDAMAGVVNIIMKKNFEGLEFNFGGGHRDRDEGLTSKEFSIVGGFQTDKGGVTFSIDHQQRDGIADADRHFTAAWQRDLDGDGTIQAYNETDGWSIYGATVASPDWSEAHAAASCDALTAEYGSDTFRYTAADEDWGPGSSYCMYAYANVSYNKASVDRNTLYIDADYDLTDDIEWFGRAMFTQNNSFGRYAPPAAQWRGMSADNPDNPYDEATTGFYRWVGIGTRDGNVHDYNQDFLTGLRGELDFLNASWEVYYHYNKADNKSIGEYYLSYAGLAYNIQNDIPLGSQEGQNNMKQTTLTQGTSDFHQYNAGIGFDLFELPGGDVAHYVGIEYFDTVFNEQYDAQSEIGLVGGSAGNSSGGDRQVFAMFYEAALPVIDSVEVNIAARYDDYSDFGSNVSPKVNVRWQALDSLVLRASYSESFRAPALDQLYAATTFSADSGTDYPYCQERGVADTDCASKQYDTYIRPNANLGPETSEYINLGIAWDATDDFGIKVDYFDLNIDNVISRRSITNVMEGIYEGTLQSTETFYVNRAPAGADGLIGKALEVGTGFGNGDKMQITGLDLSLNGNFETGFGEFGINWTNSFIFDYIVEVAGGDEATNTAGWAGQPEYKSVFTTTYTIGDHRIGWNMNYTDSTYENKTEGELDSWLIHNLNYTYDIGNYGRVMVGVNNLTDEDPVLTSKGKYENADLYNNYGREYTLRYSISF
ncbi:TonB-dependent receptor [Litorilituus lipolyticus]|uniref:TonB-dependent receptor n=1 Tax=Litorilituus lipolyticus TaxID=2491017 RepID=A0A502L5H8_9GAMM|nr:TonB-dependent receptor [Litorilituus lipolyticus]TPH19160.1 TonB-dependent receptor [Litorilituus lipolyticus]